MRSSRDTISATPCGSRSKLTRRRLAVRMVSRHLPLNIQGDDSGFDRRDCTVIDELAHFRFRDARELGELRQRELGVLGQPHRFGMF